MYTRYEIPSTDGYILPLDAYVMAPMPEIEPVTARPAIVICPGGGYAMLAPREAEPVALTFAAMGYNTFVAWYRVSPYRYPCPQQDIAAAVAWVRAHALETHTDPQRIATLGFSAGGHCAGSLGVWWQKAALWKEMGLTPADVRPNAQVLCYPVITSGEKAHRGSFENLSGTGEIALHEPYSLEKQVTENTPPTFLWHTWDDELVPVENTSLMAQALRHHNVPCEVHIFPHGRHGSALCNSVTSGTAYPDFLLSDCAQWPQLANSFLQSIWR